MAERRKKYDAPLIRISIALPDDAIVGLEKLANHFGFNRSEFLIRLGRGEFHVSQEVVAKNAIGG